MRKMALITVLTIVGFILTACFGGGAPTPTLYNVSGTIKDDSGGPIADVTLHFTDNKTTSTDSDGKWQLNGLQGSVTVTPAHDAYTFTPESKKVNKAQSDVDFVGTLKPEPTYTASGKIVDAKGNPIANVAVRFGSAAESVKTGADGTWSRSGLSGEITVTPDHPAYVFDPTEAIVSENDAMADYEGELQPCTSGNYSTNDPCVMTEYGQLKMMKDKLNGHYELGNDIDASASQNENFEPIGSNENGAAFTGTFNGNGYTIKNLYINRPDEDHVGFFGYVLSANSHIHSVQFVGGQIVGASRVGGIVGFNRSGTIESVYVDVSVIGREHVGGVVGGAYGGTWVKQAENHGSVEGEDYVGGITGYLYESLQEDTINTGAITGTESSTGGIVGYNYASEITNSSNSGTITGVESVGGVLGYNAGDSAIVDNAANTGDVIGENQVGGVIGYNSGGVVKKSYNLAAIQASEKAVGGVVGMNRSLVENSYNHGSVKLTGVGSNNPDVGGVVGGNLSGTITNTYNIGEVSGFERAGGVTSRNMGTIERSYYDMAKTPQSNGGEGKSDAELKQEGTYNQWDYANVWQISEGMDYPDLRENQR